MISKAISKLFRKQEMKCLMVGLDCAGKTTILYAMSIGSTEGLNTIPTIGFNVETFKQNNISFTVWDVSAQKSMR